MRKHISHYGLRRKNARSEFDRHAQVQSVQGDVDHVGFLGARDSVRLQEWSIKTRMTGLEPATSGVTGRCSNQLSYIPKHSWETTCLKLAISAA
jgi:hypothetical protein